MFNPRMDLDDPVLGFASRWVEAIAQRVDRVTVVTMAAGRVEPPKNMTVRSVGKERGWSEPRRAAAFYDHCLGVIRTDRPDACFSHMMPVFSLLFTPLSRLYRIPTLLWYAHGAVPPELRLAERLVDRCVTSTQEGFRLPSRKLHVLQQGIDVERLKPPDSPPVDWETTVVSLGRIGPVKRLLETVDAIAVVRARGLPVRLEVFGAPATETDRHYEQRVKLRVDEIGVGDSVGWNGRIRFDQVGEAYRRGGIFLNLSRSGSLDKAILEAIACGCVPISNNEAFAALARARGWQDLVPGRATTDVADALSRTMRLDAATRHDLRSELREYVVADHSLDGLADRIVRHIEELRERSGAALVAR